MLTRIALAGKTEVNKVYDPACGSGSLLLNTTSPSAHMLSNWWFSILDIIAILTEQPDYKKVRNYWKWLKKKLADEGSETEIGSC